MADEEEEGFLSSIGKKISRTSGEVEEDVPEEIRQLKEEIKQREEQQLSDFTFSLSTSDGVEPLEIGQLNDFHAKRHADRSGVYVENMEHAIEEALSKLLTNRGAVEDAKEELQAIEGAISQLESSMEVSGDKGTNSAEEGIREVQEWTRRWERVVFYINFLDRQVMEGAQSFQGRNAADVEQNLIKGFEEFDPDTNTRGWASEGHNFGGLEGIFANGEIKYGLAGLLEDLKIINERFLEPVIPSEGEGAIQRLENSLRASLQNFNSLVQYRFYLDEIEMEEQGLEEFFNMVEQRHEETGEMAYKNELESLREIREETGELEEYAVNIGELEIEFFEALEEGAEVLKQIYEIEEYTIEEGQHISGKLRLSGDIERSRQKYMAAAEEGTFEINDNSGLDEKLYYAILTLQKAVSGDMDSAVDVTDSVVSQMNMMDANIKELLSRDQQDGQIEAQALAEILAIIELEGEEIQELSQELQQERQRIEQEKEREQRLEEEADSIAHEAANEINEELTQHFEVSSAEDLKEQFVGTTKELQSAAKKLKEKDADEKDKLVDEENVDRALRESQDELEALITEIEDNGLETTVNVGDHSGTPEEVLSDIVDRIVTAEDHLSRDVDEEEGELEELIEAAEEIEDALNRAQNMKQAIELYASEKSRVKNRLESEFDDEELIAEGLELFHERLVIPKSDLERMIEVVRHDRISELLSVSDDLMDDILGADHRELKVLRDIGKIAEDEERKIEKFKQTIRDINPQGERGEKFSNIVDTLNDVEQKLDEMREEEDVLETDIGEEIGDVEDVEDDIEGSDGSSVFDPLEDDDF